MPRDHIDFINARSLNWRQKVFDNFSPNLDVKILSLDSETGAASAIIRYPAGWEQDGPCWLMADEEFLVLDGSIEIGDKIYDVDCYAYLPAGIKREKVSSHSGASLIVFYSATPEWAKNEPTLSLAAHNDAIPFLDSFEMAWNCEDMDPAYGDTGMRWKILRHDPKTKDVTMLVSAPAHFHPKDWCGAQEIHDCVEEMFLLSGDYIGDRGIMDAGTYFWRPPGEKHGPYGSRGGSLGLFRTLGADLTNNWTSNVFELNKAPKFDPLITNEQSMKSAKLWQRPLNF